MWDVKEPTHFSKRVGHEVPSDVAVLCKKYSRSTSAIIAAKTQPAQSNKQATTTSYLLLVQNIHRIPKWRPISYSFVCVLISPLCLVNMYI